MSRVQASPHRSAGGELARAGGALALSLLALPIWQASGASEAYRRAVVGAAERIVLATQHFPLLSGFPGLTPPSGDFVVLLAIGLTLASIGSDRRRRVGLLAIALVVTAGLQTLAAVASIHLESAAEMARSQGLLVLLPAEFQLVSQAKLALYYSQLAVIFTLFLLTSPWFDGDRAIGRPLAFGCVLGAILLAGSSMAWGRWRETDERHVAAHAKIGHLFWAKHDDAVAGEQYRISVAGGTVDPEVYFNLAGIEARRGRLAEASRLLRRCAVLGADPVWAARVTRAHQRITAAGAGSR